ncbi:MAG: SH3 domain-containing C40 family peptidase [Clostridiales bacterium]|nr:C40 family peptidase [Roseburia sp.]MDD7636389.1 SH3 domain-containing C40 family peptidase [Clostridiales bacterium]MDY4113497.1 SH3 domain-containing C40 family peptidase [Roseburia sp.]
MKARMMRVAGLLLAGTIAFSIAYTNPIEDINIVAGGNARAGISSEFCTELETYTENTTAVAGVTGAVSDYISSSIEVAAAEVSETDTVMTAMGQEETFGYTNLGIADVDGNLNVREAATTEAKLVGKMPNNAGCEILGIEGDWTKIKSGEVEGYVKSEYLLSGDAALIRAAEVKQTIATVTTMTLYVREQPNTECTIITSMPMGEELEVIEVLDGWVKVNVDSDEGYVCADYVDISTELPKAMTMTEVRYGQGVSDVRVSLVQYATQFVGNPYVWGGTSLTRGADCSGFVLSVYANFGVSLPHSSRSQANCGTKISASEAKPGDLFFYGNGSGINHVAIYIGNGQVVHASSPRTGIKISGAYYRTPVKVVRIIND